MDVDGTLYTIQRREKIEILGVRLDDVGSTLDRRGPNFLHLGPIVGTNAAILVSTWTLMQPPWQ